MTDLKLLALDAEDLQILSAHMQDSVFKPGDMDWVPKRGQFSLVVNRFVWEKADRGSKGYERRRAVLAFKRVAAVRTLGLDRRRADEVYSLLAIRFQPRGEGPEGQVELVLAGGAAISLDVECIEAQLADTGGAWETDFRPKHD
ncbi:DUF2948 family protein [Rhizobium sp. SSA_523]|uniref:DUF2948 family protein n=1 Tax=Rhizobium sp. SSA_523 TaxID=2952477 RepID=UPI002090ED01|nr:DUF2948 family protein [Rhizobium sp. SSA_523]MCO5732962.1 DUF2948 family protein [Rhizobium sp. SSA_523]WKC23847.1 DUF2948 family protein [Rhizobium sp. SSA_523]